MRNAFYQGSQILDSVIIANECLDNCFRFGTLGFLCKFDVGKAYDRVNWDFLIYLFQRCGLGKGGDNGYIFASLHQISVLVNVTSTVFFSSSWGL